MLLSFGFLRIALPSTCLFHLLANLLSHDLQAQDEATLIFARVEFVHNLAQLLLHIVDDTLVP